MVLFVVGKRKLCIDLRLCRDPERGELLLQRHARLRMHFQIDSRRTKKNGKTRKLESCGVFLRKYEGRFKMGFRTPNTKAIESHDHRLSGEKRNSNKLSKLASGPSNHHRLVSSQRPLYNMPTMTTLDTCTLSIF
jgi:hypothetical protein